MGRTLMSGGLVTGVVTFGRLFDVWRGGGGALPPVSAGGGAGSSLAGGAGGGGSVGLSSVFGVAVAGAVAASLTGSLVDAVVAIVVDVPAGSGRTRPAPG